MLASQPIRIIHSLRTADLLAVLRNEWTRTMADGGYAQVVAVDTAGAFDRVAHAGVIIKAQDAGIGGNLLAWLRDYLNGRWKLYFGGYKSYPYAIRTGVPESSILGPTLFLFYVRDIDYAVHFLRLQACNVSQ